MQPHHEVCVALGESKFLNHGVRFTFHASRNAGYQKLEHAGLTELRSVLMDLGQLWMKKERMPFPKVRHAARPHAREGHAGLSRAVLQIDGIGSRHSEALKMTLMKFVDPANPMVTVKAVSAVQDWPYSGPAHWDEERTARVKRWPKESYDAYATKALDRRASVYWELDLWVQGILAEPSLSTERT
jgi:hypothetical protein